MSRRRGGALAALGVIPVWLAIAMLPARADPVESECLPADFALRVPLEPPGEIARRVRELLAVGEDPAQRREALRMLFREAGCASIEERSDPRLSGPSLVCGMPGRTSELVAVGASPDYDGASPSALLPALAAVLARSDRSRSFELVAFGPDPSNRGVGASVYREELSERNGDPILVVHLGYVGHGPLQLERRTTGHQQCLLTALADHLGLPLLERQVGPRLNADCAPTAHIPCVLSPVDGQVTPGSIAFAGLTARLRGADLRADSHYAGYRLLAAYLLTVDQLGVQ